MPTPRSSSVRQDPEVVDGDPESVHDRAAREVPSSGTVSHRNFGLPDYFINRELSLLSFNRRVLEQAEDPDTPLLERLKFLCISSTNLDEFFEIRVAGLKQRLEIGSTLAGPDGMAPQDVLDAIRVDALEIVNRQYRLLNEVLMPALADRNIRFVRRHEWGDVQRAWLRSYFLEQVEPVLSPLGLDPARPIPRILNKSLNFIVPLRGKDAFGRNSSLAIVQAPRSLPRLIRLPPEVGGNGPDDFVFLSSVIHAFVEELFSGIQVLGCYQFRVTRNSDLFVDDEEVDDLLRALEGELASRRYGAAVRLETAPDCPAATAQFLLDHFALGAIDLYQVNGPVNLNRLLAVYDLVDRPDLKYRPFTPGVPQPLVGGGDMFSVMRRHDILLCHPFQSFAPVVDLVRQAAADPDVLAIKQTLYRTGPESAVVDGLVAAAKAGKEVTVIIELRARFDEADNILLATRLQEAGAHVVYGVVGFKTHAKMLLVVRREKGVLRRYAHVATGNYHPRTARLYTDYGLFTSDATFGNDLHELFLQLTSLTRVPKLIKFLQSPFTLHDAVEEKIRRETQHAAEGRHARIIVKVNALVEPTIIQALYAASAAGVSIDLIVRGICCLRPGIPGISENIRVRSIVGRFLEHSRVYYFHNGGSAETFCASADWMDRNFFGRIELAFPIEDPEHRQRLLDDLEVYLADNTQAWILAPDGSYRRCRPGDDPPFASQLVLLEKLAAS
ncbi:polyphosphate kinase 1 [soil metagenome]